MAITLTAANARALLLHAQGMASPRPAAATPEDALDAIRRMDYLQIDTISVVARSPYLVLWSRIGDYDQRWLDELLAAGDLFEYWAHAACMIPSEHFGHYRRIIREGMPRRLRAATRWLDNNPAIVERIRSHIVDNGPVRSADFERTDGRKGNGWWDWKEEKLALEIMFTAGHVTVARRQAFQRVYDLVERVRPGWNDDHAPTIEEARDALALRSVRSLGVGRLDWTQDYRYTIAELQAAARARLKALAARDELIEVEVEGWKQPGYVHPDWRDALDGVGDIRARAETSLLSPFDPIVSDRNRGRELFNFDYTIECYTPEPKRRYGYFTLPILEGDAIIGRLDAKAHRANGLFEVKALHLEPGVAITAERVDGLRDVLGRAAAWHGTPEIAVRKSDPPALASAFA